MKTIFGVIHLPALPGDVRGESFSKAYSAAMRDAEALAEGGVHGLVLENFGSAPFYKGDRANPVPPHQVAALAVITTRCEAAFPHLKIGVNCLRNDARSALGIAAATNADFIRVNIHTGAAVTDQGIIEGDAANTLAYRQMLGVDVQIFADILVKHAVPMGEVDPKRAAEETVGRGLADAVIVTGHGTGAPVDITILKAAKSGCGPAPLFIGSGLHVGNAGELLSIADGAIVGTTFKFEGLTKNAVDVQRVKALMAQVINQVD